MEKLFMITVAVFLAIMLFAQNQNPALQVNRTNIWKFGAQSVPFPPDAPSLHFVNDTDVVVENTGLSSSVSTLSDLLGNILTYSGDFKMCNGLDTLMKNAGIFGDSGYINVSQNTLPIPKPKSPDTVYYFASTVALRYSVIYTNGDNGNGEVVKRNVRLFPGTVGVKLTAVHHCNGSDVWVVGHEWESDKFFAYLVTENGIDTTPVISQVGPIDNSPGDYQAGCIKFSPDGNKLAYSSSGTIPQHLFDFDKSTGIFSNPISLILLTSSSSLSFSPDNSKLYVSSNNGVIVQYNLVPYDSASIVSSRRVIVNQFPAGFPHMQLGRNGKIYVQQGGSDPYRYYLGVINKPNLSDTLCDFDPLAVSLNGRSGGSDGIMTTIESYFYTGTTAFPCYGDTIDTVNTLVDDALPVYARVYPNPFTEYTVIEIEGAGRINGTADYKLYDGLGREYQANITELRAGNNEIKAVLEKGELKPGIYFLSVETKKHTVTLKLSIL